MDKYEGLAAQELADAIRRDFSPVWIPDELPFADYVPEGWPQGWHPATWPDDGSRIGLAVPVSWLGYNLFDLHNLIGSSDKLEVVRLDYPPGDLTETTDSGNDWEVGIGTIAGISTNMWSPIADRKGDLARKIMYVALMYPCELWHGRAVLVMADGTWPLLTTYGRLILGKWNEDDPVDERERWEVDAIIDIQGNENPFVTFPELYDYLWGEKAGEGYIPPGKKNRVPLKAEYSRSADGVIDLYSPYIAEGARWAFDGKRVDGDNVSLEGISTGFHEISYTRGSEKGRIKVEVKP